MSERRPEPEDVPVIEAPAKVIAPKPDDEHSKTRESIREDAALTETARQTQGQRDISAIWETTQRYIALSVTWASLSVAMWLAAAGKNPDVEVASTVFLYGVANLVIGFYFGRTNHSRVGGSGDTRDV